MVRSATMTSLARSARRRAAVLAAVALVLAGCARPMDDAAGRTSAAASPSHDDRSSTAPSTLAAAVSPAAEDPSTGAVTVQTPSGTPSSSGTPDTGLASLEGTTWLLARAVIDGTVFDFPQPRGSSVTGSYTVQFAGGRLVANDGCNTLQTGATVGARTFTTAGDVMTTQVGCDQSLLREAYDRELFIGTVGWTRSGGDLVLTTGAGTTFEFTPFTAGYPSDLAGDEHVTTPEKSVDGVRFRIYGQSQDHGYQCLTMEFASPAGTPWEPVGSCRDDLAERYVVNPTDFSAGLLPSGTGVVFGATPDGSTSRIVFRPSAGGSSTEVTQTPLPGTKFHAFYGFIEQPTGGGTVTFYDAKGKPYQNIWRVRW